MDQQQRHPQTGFHTPHNDREDTAADYTARCQHLYSTWVGNPFVQRCRCGDWYYSHNPNSIT